MLAGIGGPTTCSAQFIAQKQVALLVCQYSAQLLLQPNFLQPSMWSERLSDLDCV